MYTPCLELHSGERRITAHRQEPPGSTVHSRFGSITVISARRTRGQRACVVEAEQPRRIRSTSSRPSARTRSPAMDQVSARPSAVSSPMMPLAACASASASSGDSATRRGRGRKVGRSDPSASKPDRAAHDRSRSCRSCRRPSPRAALRHRRARAAAAPSSRSGPNSSTALVVEREMMRRGFAGDVRRRAAARRGPDRKRLGGRDVRDMHGRTPHRRAIARSRRTRVLSARAGIPATPRRLRDFAGVHRAMAGQRAILLMQRDRETQCATLRRSASMSTSSSSIGMPSSEKSRAPASAIAAKSTNSRPASPSVTAETGIRRAHDRSRAPDRACSA